MITVKCYGKTEHFIDREQAMERYYDCVLHSSGSEQNTYYDILSQIALGLDYCTDEDYPRRRAYGRIIRYK